MANSSTLSRQFNDQGFVVLESVFSAAQCDEMIAMFDNYWLRAGKPSFTGFGMAIHPLLQKMPEMADFCAHHRVIDALGDVLGEQPRLMHTGARVSNEESAHQIGWHDHYSWDKAGITTRTRPERVLFGCYLRGSNLEYGPLVVKARKVNDPLLPLPINADQHWDGELRVIAPPGSVVIFDTALYHTAHRGSQKGRRYLWGTHVQGISETRAHPEDNSSEHPVVAERKKQNAELRRFIDG